VSQIDTRNTLVIRKQKQPRIRVRRRSVVTGTEYQLSSVFTNRSQPTLLFSQPPCQPALVLMSANRFHVVHQPPTQSLINKPCFIPYSLLNLFALSHCIQGSQPPNLMGLGRGRANMGTNPFWIEVDIAKHGVATGMVQLPVIGPPQCVLDDPTRRRQHSRHG